MLFFELCRKIRKVTIRPGEGYLGRCFDYRTIGYIEELSYSNTPYARQSMQDEVVLYFAGHIAETHFLKGKNSKIQPHSWDTGALSIAAQVVSKGRTRCNSQLAVYPNKGTYHKT